METPVYDFLVDYAEKNGLRAHMPGHKGKAPDERLSGLFRLDITEIAGADSLFEAEGIIAQSERNTAALYGSAASAFSAGGSTLCIQAMLAIMKMEGRRIIAARNVHRAFLNAAALLGLDVEWVLPRYSGGILSGELALSDVEEALAASDKPACFYVTSPDYTGRLADIAGLAEVCRRHGARLIVDGAHGAHLAFFEKNLHPIALGADMCCDSFHKMLPALTGAAVLHTSREEYAPLLKQAMSLFGSTSPSYLIMASLDLCNRYIAENIRSDIAAALPGIAELKSSFAGKLLFADGDPFHITVRAAESGFCGTELADLLRSSGVECEYADDELLILLLAPSGDIGDLRRLRTALEGAVAGASPRKKRSRSLNVKLPRMACTIREAAFSASEEITVEEAEGRICASVKVPCPPAVPIAVSGEVIDRDCIEIFRQYGIKTVLVVRER